MNATLQCLLHIKELNNYFIMQYPKDKRGLSVKNRKIETKGEISEHYHEIVDNLCDRNDKTNYFSPDRFKSIIGKYNEQFRAFEANDSKDLILYILQTIHEELNYSGDCPFPDARKPSKYDKNLTFDYFTRSYLFQNESIISKLFYGIYENVNFCENCKQKAYSYQTFSFLSFPVREYNGKNYNIEFGFQDLGKEEHINGKDKLYCSNCKGNYNCILSYKIKKPPQKMLINIDYGTNKQYSVKSLKFEDYIDIRRYLADSDGGDKESTSYRLIGVCTHLGMTGRGGHYIAYCCNSSIGKWYRFNDSDVSKCHRSEINSGKTYSSPYLLLYEKFKSN